MLKFALRMEETDRVQKFKSCLHHLILYFKYSAIEVVHAIRTSNIPMRTKRLYALCSSWVPRI
jgi:hypothetical protein